MKNGNESPLYKKMKFLYSTKGIDISKKKWAIDAVKAMFQDKILDYEGYAKEKVQLHNDIAKTLKRHTKPDSDPLEISVEWIKRYCDFFGCSSDYLLGYIETPLHTSYDDVPLTFTSITALNRIRQQEEYDKACVQLLGSFGIDHTPHNLIELLNHIVSSPRFTDFLGAIEAYMNPQYCKPMYHLLSQESITGKADYRIPTSQIHKRPSYDDTGSIIKDDIGQPVYDYYLALVKDENKPSDYRSVKIDDSFLEGVAIRQLENCMDSIKKDYLNQSINGIVE